MSTQLELYYIPNYIPLNNVSNDEILKQIELNVIQTISKTIYELFKIFYENYMINSQYSDLLYKDLLYNLNESNAKEIDKYKFNIYEFLDIPNLSYILNNDEDNKISNDKKIQYILPKTIFEEFNAVGSIFKKRNNRSNIKPNFYIYNPGQKWNTFLYVNYYTYYIPSEKNENYYTNPNDYIINCHENDINLCYKIHFMPKYEYIIYTLLKLIKILNDNFSDYRFNIKYDLNSRSSVGLMESDELIDLEYNGGPSASIVLYSSSDKQFTLNLLRVIVGLFKEESLIGAMSQDIPHFLSVPIYNVRINNLICYAHGDRNTKTVLELEDRKNFKKLIPKLKKSDLKIPQWLYNLKDKCTNNEKINEKINKKSYSYIGEKICDIDLNDDCIDKHICYLTLDKEHMINPEEIEFIISKNGKYKYNIKNNEIVGINNNENPIDFLIQRIMAYEFYSSLSSHQNLEKELEDTIFYLEELLKIIKTKWKFISPVNVENTIDKLIKIWEEKFKIKKGGSLKFKNKKTKLNKNSKKIIKNIVKLNKSF